jgi:hypothetical protein
MIAQGLVKRIVLTEVKKEGSRNFGMEMMFIKLVNPNNRKEKMEITVFPDEFEDFIEIEEGNTVEIEIKVNKYNGQIKYIAVDLIKNENHTPTV